MATVTFGVKVKDLNGVQCPSDLTVTAETSRSFSELIFLLSPVVTFIKIKGGKNWTNPRQLFVVDNYNACLVERIVKLTLGDQAQSDFNKGVMDWLSRNL